MAGQAERPGVWWRRAAGWFAATPGELAGLALVLTGGAVAAVLVWFGGVPRPAGGTAPPPVPTPVSPGGAGLTVHVAGAVRTPGVVRLPGGARVSDALAAAGGPRWDADLDAVNLARPVGDGERILVPERAVGAAGQRAGQGGSGSGAHRPDGRIDLNRATAADLEELPGIGPVLAGRIVAWREDHGPFTEIGQLREVPGIGERTFQALADLVAV